MFMEQKIEELTDKEKAWIESQLSGATTLVEIMVPEAAGQPLTLKALDQAFAGWMATKESDSTVINAIINQVGIAFGQFLVDGIGLRWVIATDKNGTDLAVYGLPGQGDVLVYPANLVAKRWERRETQFLENCFHETATRVQALSSGAAVPGAAPRGFFKRLFGK
jgi:hypothetical protein